MTLTGRPLRALAVLAIGGALVSCIALFDFDYDTAEQVRVGPPVEPGGAPDGAFDAGSARFSVRADDVASIRGKTVTLTVQIARQPEFAEPVSVGLELPPWMEPLRAVIADAETSVVPFDLAIAADAPHGDASIRIVASAGGASTEGRATLTVTHLPGEADESFGTKGIASFELPASAGQGRGIIDLAVRPPGSPLAGRILAAGHATSPTAPLVGGIAAPDTLFVGQLLEDGALDTAFGNGTGISAFPASASLEYSDEGVDLTRPAPVRMALQSDGKVLIAAETAGPVGFKRSIVLARLLEQGGLDLGFGSGGKISIADGASSLALGDVALQGTDILVLAAKHDRIGTSTGGLVIKRYTQSGVEDPAFAPMAFAGVGAYGYQLVVEPDGRVLAAGAACEDGGLTHLPPAPFRSALVRILPDAGLDPTFGNGGTLLLGATTSTYHVHAFSVVTRTAGGYVAGSLGARGDVTTVIARLHHDGGIDTTFGAAGYAELHNTSATPRGIAFVGDGGVLAVGNIWNLQLALRLFRSDGATEPIFVTPTFGVTERGGYPGQALVVDMKGRFLIPWAGPAMVDGGKTAMRVARFLL